MTGHPTSLKFACPSCETHLDAPPKLFGSRISCPSCHNDLVVPVPEHPAPGPPKTEVLPNGEVPGSASTDAGIWNPTHAANLAVLLCPPLGPAVHALNWKALGHPDLSRRSWVWAALIAGSILVLLALSAVVPEAAGKWAVVVICLVVAWYFTLGRKQISTLHAGPGRFRPILPVALVGALLSGMIAAAGIFTAGMGDRMLMEKAAAPLVSDILVDSLGSDAAVCVGVNLGEKLAKGFYRGIAILDNGNTLAITARREEDRIVVRITSTGGSDAPMDGADSHAVTSGPSSADEGVRSEPSQQGDPSEPERDPAIGFPRSDARDFTSMAEHYGFGDFGTPALDSFPDPAWRQILNEDKHQVRVLKSVLKTRGCTREEWYATNDRTGYPDAGNFRSKPLVLCATLPVGLYTVTGKKDGRLLLTQSKEVKGTALWPDDWRALMGAMPLQVLLEGGNVGTARLAVGDRISFIGIQTSVAEGDTFTPLVRPLGIRNETTREFYNLENPASPVGELDGARKAAAERSAEAAGEESAREARRAEERRQAEEAEAALQQEHDRVEQRRKEWLREGEGGGDDDPFAAVPSSAKSQDLPHDLTAAKAELEKVNATIEAERARMRQALGTINRLTANKTRPVRERSPAYHECLAASKVIQEVEKGAQALKDRKAALESRIRELE